MADRDDHRTGEHTPPVTGDCADGSAAVTLDKYENVCELPCRIQVTSEAWMNAILGFLNPQLPFPSLYDYHLVRREVFSADNSLIDETTPLHNKVEHTRLVNSTDPSAKATLATLIQFPPNWDRVCYQFHLIPRVKEKDNEIEETVTLFRSHGGRPRLVFVPTLPQSHLTDPKYLPFYHPKVKGLAVSLIEGSPQKLLLEARFFDTVTFRNAMVKIGGKLLKTFHSRCASLYREKSVHHDQIVPYKDLNECYERLRAKYKYWVDIWEESTDPQKFVFEDIGIAAFLICLWAIEGDPQPHFIDLGCGNGFLVYLLTMEGYEGSGIDLQRRNLWAKFPQIVQDRLVAKIIAPDQETFDSPTNTTWLIGNHCDELTPWMPFVASKSPNLKVFTLPCCFFDFNGKKFDQSDPKIGKFRTYLDCVERIHKLCGFAPEREFLRIPSTKNVAFIGRRRIEGLDPLVLEQNRRKLLKDAGFTRFVPKEEPKPSHSQKHKTTRPCSDHPS